jgi:hypothetical protein
MRENYEWFVGTNTDELIRLRFSRLRSFEISRKLIREKCEKENVNLDENIINEKAKGLSSTIESALNYWNIDENSLNAKILSRYYALLQLTIAEEVASIKNNSDLKEAQKHTEQGHGLTTLNLYSNDDFLDNYYCYFRKDGHFYYYMQQIGYNKDEEFFTSKKIKENDNINDFHLVTLADLFRRIPELQKIVEEYIGKCPLVLNFGLDSTGEYERKEKQRKEYQKKTEKFEFEPPVEAEDEILTNVSIYPTSKNMTIEYVKELNSPFTNFSMRKDSFSDGEHIVCDFIHKNEGIWWNSIKRYKSDYCPTSYIIPLFDKIQDPIIINYVLMYTLSIIVRYLPNIWYEITSGKYDNIGSLIEYYISIFDHVIPLQMLERITNKDIHISMPGGFDAPV